MTPLPEDADLLPMSFAQRRFWFLDKLEPGNPAYLMPAQVELAGTLDPEVLRGALNDVVARHETLRTAFGLDEGEPVQVIVPEVTLDLPLVDLCGLDEADREGRLEALAREEASTPFDLSRPPLIRARLAKVAGDRHVLFLTMHHIVSDGWSMGVLMKDLSAFFTARVIGQPPAVDDLAIQYGDFADWQQEHLSGDRLDDMVAAWARHLDGAPPLLTLPTDRPRPALQTSNGAVHAFALGRDLSNALSAFAQTRRATPLMVMMAVYAVFLGRLAGQEDVVVGTPIANRTRSELEPLIGLFANTLPLRVRLSGEPSFAALVDQVRGTALEAYARQDLPFERLVEALQPERSLGYSPVFQSMFILQNLPPSELVLPGLTLRERSGQGVTAKVDLTLTMAPGGDGGLDAVMEYNTDLFDAATIARWAGYFQTLLAAAVTYPERSLASLPLMTEEERRAVIASGAGPTAPIPDLPVHRQVEAWAAKAPQRRAVACGDAVLTYGALWARAQAVAEALRGRGVQPGDRVGVCVERGPDMPAALLGVLAAGAAYVPMDPIYPPDRLSLMLEDSGAAVVITGGDGEAAVRGGPAALLRMEDVPARPGAEVANHDNPLAYVIYTSGSTGRPKGVAIGHEGLANLLATAADTLGFGEDDVFLAVTTMSFDIATLEMFLPLTQGAAVEIATAEDAADGRRLAARLEETAATWLQATPITFRLLLEAEWQGKSDLSVMIGGEAFPIDMVRPLLTRTAGVWNVYGPTEATIWASFHRVAEADADGGEGGVPLGMPLANLTYHVVDGTGAVVPPGVAGELLIGGVGLAMGYHGRADLTAAAFVPDPFGPPGAVLYRTGDLVRRHADGRLVYLNRIDHQVKIRGFRIELGEIEAALRACHGVADAAVTVRGSGAAAMLVAYVAAPGTAHPDPSALRQALTEGLPDYMVPARYVFLDALPRTPNGKIDRKALPDDGGVAAVVSEPPRDGLERRLADIWRKVLDLPAVGRSDNFFAIGGHSLLVISLLGEVQAVFGRRLAMTVLFQNPTIADLAAVLRKAPEPEGEGRLVRLADGPAEPPLFLLPGAGGNPLYLNRLARCFAGDRTVYSFEYPGVDGVSAPATSVEELGRLAAEAFTAVWPTGPCLLAGHSFGSGLALEAARILMAEGRDITRVIVLDTVAPVMDHVPVNLSRDNADWIHELAHVASQMLGKPVPLEAEEVRHLPHDQALAVLAERLGQAGWNSPFEGMDRLAGMLEVYKTSYGTLYQPEPPISVPLALLPAEDSRTPDTDVVDDADLLALLAEHDWGWERVTGLPVEVHVVAGNHASMVMEPHVEGLARVMQDVIAKALGEALLPV